MPSPEFNATSTTAGKPCAGSVTSQPTHVTAMSATVCRSELCSRAKSRGDERSASRKWDARCLAGEVATRRLLVTPTTTATSATTAPTARPRGSINRSCCKLSAETITITAVIDTFVTFSFSPLANSSICYTDVIMVLSALRSSLEGVVLW